MKYCDTKTYVIHVNDLRVEFKTLHSELATLLSMPIKQRTPVHKKRLTTVRNRLKTIDRNLAGTHSLWTFTMPDLFLMLIEAEGCEWNNEQITLLDSDLESYEGRGERALRHRYGLSLGPSRGSCDFPDDGEGKFIGNKTETFRVGKAGKRAYGRLHRSLVREFSEDAMSPDQWDMLSDGEVPAGNVYHNLPEAVRVRLQSSLAPEEVLSCYQTIFLMSDDGFVRVPRCDFASAFSLAMVTQMGPKYRLRREYVETRLRAINLADVA